MKIQNFSHETPKKDLISRVQKGVVGLLLLLLLAFVGLFFLMNANLERHKLQQDKLGDFFSVVHHAEEHWLEWLLIEDRQLYDEGSLGYSSSHLYQILTKEYDLIEQNLVVLDSLSSFDASEAKNLLESLSHKFLLPLSEDDRTSIYNAIEVLENLGEELSEMGIIFEYERQVFVEKLIWWPIAIFLLIAFFVIYWAVSYIRQMRSGFAYLHNVVDQHKHLSTASQRSCTDEFTHVGHFLSSELESQNFDLALMGANLQLLEVVFSHIEEAFFVTNDAGDVMWMSAGAERLWLANAAAFEPALGIYAGVESPIGERVVDSILQSDKEVMVKLSSGVYGLKVNRLGGGPDAEEESLRSIVSLESKSDMAELKILHSSLKLMENDVWGAPIRVLRKESPYIDFSRSLEVVRQNVGSLFNELNNVHHETVTKLQQIPSLLVKNLDQDKLIKSEGLEGKSVVPIRDIQLELHEVAGVSENVRDSLLLGYELVLQRLALVEKDLTSDVLLLRDVERWLNEVRVGVLSSLSAAEGESVNVRRRFSVDLEHDISKVQSQVEAMRSVADLGLSSLQSDRHIGNERLDLARESINDMVEKIHELMDKSTPQVEAESRQLIEGLSGE